MQDGAGSEEYSVGYIVATNSTSILKVKINFKNRTALCLKYIDSIKQLVGKALKLRKNNKFITKYKAAIDEFFGIDSVTESTDED